MNSTFFVYRYILYCLDVVLATTGLMAIVFASQIKSNIAPFKVFIEDQYNYIPDIIIVIGMVIILIALLGWFGASRGNSGITLLFSTCLLLVFFLEVAISASGYLLKVSTRHSLQKSLIFVNKNNGTKYLSAWNHMQTELSCCGVNGPKDWIKVYGNSDIPLSCCTNLQSIFDFANECTLDSLNLNSRGCLESMEDFLVKNASCIQEMGLFLTIFQLVGIIISCHLANEFRKGYREV